ncbi:MAG: Tm-1-like ATP-binding domain-containing protein, partial [Actinobacteria bacterium]|nr:Tm-1-like ATP-binding domain-containing protein [Actinomycetota bacterium]
ALRLVVGDEGLASAASMKSRDGDRLARVRAKGVPWVVAPGGLDMHIVVGSNGIDDVPPSLRGRPLARHGPVVTLVRTNREELASVATYLAAQIKESPAASVVLPKGGFSDADRPGSPLYDPETDEYFIEQLLAALPTSDSAVVVEAHINDGSFARAVVAELARLGLALDERSA